MKRGLFLSWGATLSYMGLIFYLSSLPTIERVPAIPHIDKALHLGAYGVLAVLWVESLRRSGARAGWRLIAVVVVVCSLYGASDEFHQSFVPGRDVSVFDWAADTLGAFLGAYLWIMRRSVFL